jgi:hypothetical protein
VFRKAICSLHAPLEQLFAAPMRLKKTYLTLSREEGFGKSVKVNYKSI